MRKKGQLSQIRCSVWLSDSVYVLAVERLEIVLQFLRGEGLAAGDLGDLAEEGEVGGGVLQLAVVLIDQEAGGVAAEVLAVAGGRDRDRVLAGDAGGVVGAARLVPLGVERRRARACPRRPCG